MKLKNADVKNISTKIEYLHKRRIELAYEISTKAYNLVKGLYAEYEKNFKYSILNTLQFKPQSFDSFEKDLFGGGGFYSTKKKIVLDVINQTNPDVTRVIFVDALWFKVKYTITNEKDDDFIHRADTVGQIFVDHNKDFDFYKKFRIISELGDIVYEDSDLSRITRWEREIDNMESILADYNK